MNLGMGNAGSVVRWSVVVSLSRGDCSGLHWTPSIRVRCGRRSCLVDSWTSCNVFVSS